MPRFGQGPIGEVFAMDDAKEADVETMVGMMADIEQAEFGVKLNPAFVQKMTQYYRKLLKTPRAAMWVMREKQTGQIKAFSGYAPFSFHSPLNFEKKSAFGVALYVDPAHRGGGLADTLIKHMLSHAKTQGYDKLLMQVKNPRAVKLYMKRYGAVEAKNTWSVLAFRAYYKLWSMVTGFKLNGVQILEKRL